MPSLLVVDDDTELCAMLSEYLASEGYTVDSIHDGRQGLMRAIEGSFQLVILDMMLPGLSGLDLLRQLRRQSQVPVLMLTARGDAVDRIIGLEVGADDYLPKPFDPRELVARVRAILRRAENDTSAAEPAATKLVNADIELDESTRVVRQNGQSISLTSVEFDLLRSLMQQAGQVLSREEIAMEVFGRRLHPLERTIDVHIASLRRKLGRCCGDIERIQTIRGVGYLYARVGNS